MAIIKFQFWHLKPHPNIDILLLKKYFNSIEQEVLQKQQHFRTLNQSFFLIRQFADILKLLKAYLRF